MQTNTTVLFFLRHTSINQYVISRPAFSFAWNKNKNNSLANQRSDKTRNDNISWTSYFPISKGRYKNSMYIVHIQYMTYFTAYQTSDNEFN